MESMEESGSNNNAQTATSVPREAKYDHVFSQVGWKNVSCSNFCKSSANSTGIHYLFIFHIL